MSQKCIPSLNINQIAEMISREYLTSKIDIKLDSEELALMLAVSVKREELVASGLDEVTHTRLMKSGARPGITTEEILNWAPRTKTKFKPLERLPTLIEKKRMFALALKILIRVCMKEHIYTFNGNIEIKDESNDCRIMN